jgi:hypothetical protein
MWDNNKTLAISKKWHLVVPPSTFARNQNMGNRMEKNNWQNKWMGSVAMGEWAAWWWANVKIDKRSFTLLK